MRRRRRRQRPLWFPPLGANFTIGDDTTNYGAVTFQIGVPNNGAIGFIEFPLTFDFGQERTKAFANEVVPTQSLSDLMNSAWRLRRIVGNVFATYTPGGAPANDPSGVYPPGVHFGVGFMVRNVDETGLAPAGNVDLFNGDDYDDPWIWRRTWILGQGAGTNQRVTNEFLAGLAPNNVPFGGAIGQFNLQQYPWAQFPQSNVEYGSALTGALVDQKTNRIIGPEQRLNIHFAVKALPTQSVPYTGQPESVVTGLHDLRLLGFMTRASNKRNAAR